MRRVIIESPYAGDVETNQAYARSCMKHSINQNEAPLLSHLLYTQCLDDTRDEERGLGMACGFAWTAVADAVVVYADLGVSAGMLKGIAKARELGLDVEMRANPYWTQVRIRPDT